MEVLPGKGIGELKFGMLKGDVEKLLGIANKEWIDDENENRLILEYNDIRMRLTFLLDEDNKLSYLETSNSDLTYGGEAFINTNISAAKKIFEKVIKEWEIDEYHSFTAHFNENLWLTLQSEFEQVTHLELGVPFKNGNEYNWPT